MQLDLPVVAKTKPSLKPEAQQLDAFRQSFDRVVPADATVGVAVSGGPDSLALLLLAAAARPGRVEAATVDHALRDGSRAEAEMVAEVCERLGVPHAILTVEWKEKPQTAIQEKARIERYRLLAGWARDRSINVVATAHHVDDQAETFLMRLARGAGVKGLGSMRAAITMPGGVGSVVRPLLGWRRAALEQICADAGVTPAADPSNDDEQFERVRVRKALAETDWLDPTAIARSAANVAEADAAIHWATDMEWSRAVRVHPEGIIYTVTDAPAEIRRRIARRAVLRLATENADTDLRGRELNQLLSVLGNGGKGSLRGVLCSGGKQWRFVPAPKRSRPVDKSR